MMDIDYFLRSLTFILCAVYVYGNFPRADADHWGEGHDGCEKSFSNEDAFINDIIPYARKFEDPVEMKHPNSNRDEARDTDLGQKRMQMPEPAVPETLPNENPYPMPGWSDPIYEPYREPERILDPEPEPSPMKDPYVPDFNEPDVSPTKQTDPEPAEEPVPIPDPKPRRRSSGETSEQRDENLDNFLGNGLPMPEKDTKILEDVPNFVEVPNIKAQRKPWPKRPPPPPRPPRPPKIPMNQKTQEYFPHSPFFSPKDYTDDTLTASFPRKGVDFQGMAVGSSLSASEEDESNQISDRFFEPKPKFYNTGRDSEVQFPRRTPPPPKPVRVSPHVLPLKHKNIQAPLPHTTVFSPTLRTPVPMMLEGFHPVAVFGEPQETDSVRVGLPLGQSPMQTLLEEETGLQNQNILNGLEGSLSHATAGSIRDDLRWLEPRKKSFAAKLSPFIAMA